VGVIKRKIVLLDFVHPLNYKIIKLKRSESWILLSSSGEKVTQKTKSLSAGPPS
jgi:hypothetical protein